jgi:hypothetical protein
MTPSCCGDLDCLSRPRGTVPPVAPRGTGLPGAACADCAADRVALPGGLVHDTDR